MDSPRGAEQRAVGDPHHEPTARRLARHRAICAGPARCEHRRETANRWGRLLWVTFLGEARKVTGPARPLSALVAPATRVWRATIPLSLTLSHRGRGDQLRSWFDKLTTNGGELRPHAIDKIPLHPLVVLHHQPVHIGVEAGQQRVEFAGELEVIDDRLVEALSGQQ